MGPPTPDTVPRGPVVTGTWGQGGGKTPAAEHVDVPGLTVESWLLPSVWSAEPASCPRDLPSVEAAGGAVEMLGIQAGCWELCQNPKETWGTGWGDPRPGQPLPRPHKGWSWDPGVTRGMGYVCGECGGLWASQQDPASDSRRAGHLLATCWPPGGSNVPLLPALVHANCWALLIIIHAYESCLGRDQVVWAAQQEAVAACWGSWKEIAFRNPAKPTTSLWLPCTGG